MVRDDCATHPSNCTRLWCSKYPQSTSKIFLGKLKCVAQTHTTERLTRSNAFAGSSTKATAPKTSSPARYVNLHQNFPDCLLSSSISAISGVLIHTIHLLPFRHFWCSQGFPPTNQRRHQRNRPLTRDILQDQEEHRRPFSTLFHLFQQLHHFSSCFFCQVQGTFG